MISEKHKIALSVDIEDWYHGPAVIGSDFSKYKTIEDFEKEHSFYFEKLEKYVDEVLEILSLQKVKATFFIVADLANRRPSIIEKINKHQHEIACHSLNHYSKCNPSTNQMRFTKTEFIERTNKARSILESFTSQKVIGYRAPNAYIHPSMIDWLEEMGFLYDSSVSINSLYKKGCGEIENVDTRPYYPLQGSLSAGEWASRSIIEFPWSYWKIGSFKLPTAGGPALRLFGYNAIKNGINQSLKRGHTCLYFHAIDISEEKFPSLGNKRPFYFLIKGNIIKKRIHKLLTSFAGQFTTYQNLLQETNA